MDNVEVNRIRAHRFLRSLIQCLCVVGLVTAAQAEVKNNENCITKYRNGKPYQFCEMKPPTRDRYNHKLDAPSVGARTKSPTNVQKMDKAYSAPAIAPAAPAVIESAHPTPKSSSQPTTSTSLPTVPGATLRRLPAETAAPSASEGRATLPAAAGHSAAGSGSGLLPVRALIEPSEVPPREVAAYGIVAFSALPIGSEINRYKFVCEAFKATLISQSDLPPNTALSEQMITFWPIKDKKKAEAAKMDCGYLVPSYDLKTGLDAIHDADPKNNNLAERRGPFLIAWSPSESRYRGDSLVLVMDLSSIDEQESFMEVFRTWRHKITDDPAIWKKGFDIETVRRTVREVLDHYGESILKVIRPSS